MREGVYKDGIFKFEINIPNSYPAKPPEITFITRIYHPMIDFSTGKLDINVNINLIRKNFLSGKLVRIF